MHEPANPYQRNAERVQQRAERTVEKGDQNKNWATELKWLKEVLREVKMIEQLDYL